MQDELHSMVQRAHYITGKKVVLVAHSLGGVLVETYMRLHPYFDDHVAKFVALAVPFDGAGAISL